MKDLELLSSLTDYIHVDIKRCWHKISDESWIEIGSKLNYDVWIVTSGKIEIIVEDKKYIVCDRDAFLFYPNMIYKAQALTEQCEFIYIHFDFKIGNNFRALDDFPLAGLIEKEAASAEIGILIDGYRAYSAKKPLSMFALKGYFMTLLAKIIVFKCERNRDICSKSGQSKLLSRLAPVLKYISEHIHEKITTTNLAEAMGVSEKYFIKIFKDTIGITPGNYVSQVKMNRALDYLYEYKYSIKEIAFLLGYSDQYTFSKAFKKVHKVSPSKLDAP